MNITTNIIGVGNAATVNGIKAIKSLHEDNNTATIYETLLQKLGASLRQQIAYEHQFKIDMKN